MSQKTYMTRVFRLKTKIVLMGAIGLLSACFWGCSEREQAIPITADFSIEVVDNDFSVPVQIRIINTTVGADTYSWTFSGGTPATSSDRNPGTITYNEPGAFSILLEASNQDGISERKEIPVPIDAEIIIGFTTDILVDNFPPMEVALTNTTEGADTFNWVFQNGNPATSNEKNPANVIFNEPGEHTISLEVGNGLETFQIEETVTVAPHLVAAFDYEISFEDADLEAPITLTMVNNSISSTAYNWTFSGGNPETSTEENPTVIFEDSGTYTLMLETSNGKQTQTTSQTITVLPNTSIRVIEDVQLGINTAHSGNQIGAFFATKTGQVHTRETVTQENGQTIDIAFYGQNQSFVFNRFVSPDEVQELTFNAIPNAQHTKFINTLETCNCSASLTVAQFDAMVDDTLLEGLTITETPEGLEDFDSSMVPRIVLFETEDGRKGAIKIKDYVVDGTNSYIVVAIKVQKNG